MTMVSLMILLPTALASGPVADAPWLAEVGAGRLCWVSPGAPDPLLRVQGPDDPSPRLYRLPVDLGPADDAPRVRMRGGAVWAVSRPGVAPGQRLAHLLRIAPEVLPDFAVADDAPKPRAPIPVAAKADPIAERPLEVGRLEPLTDALHRAEIEAGPAPSFDILPVADDRCRLFLRLGPELVVQDYQFRYEEDARDYRGKWHEVSRSRVDWNGPFRVLPERGDGVLIMTAAGALHRLAHDADGSPRWKALWNDPERPIRLAVTRAEDRAMLFFGRGFQLRPGPDIRIEDDASIPEKVASDREVWDLLRRCARRLPPQP